MRPLGWAGLLLALPRAWRLSRIDGDARAGLVLLGDGERPRLECRWATVTRRQFDPQAYTERHLRQWLGKQNAAAEAQARVIEHPGLQAVRLLSDAKAKIDRLCAYSPVSRRVFDLAYYHGSAREDQQFRQEVLPGLVDQPPDQPQRWAFFDVSFTAPAGFHYQDATLNMGDMQVTLAAHPRRHRGPSLTVRQIYPARLALSRQPMEKWLKALLEEDRKQRLYAPRIGWRDRLRERYPRQQTPLGEGLGYDAQLRRLVRPILWRCPRRMRTLLVHDKGHDRLIVLRVAARREQQEPLLAELFAGLHWARRAEDDDQEDPRNGPRNDPRNEPR